MFAISTLYFRRKSYEVFLVILIVLAVFVIASSWYHFELFFTRKWGYELWLYAACAVWFFDRIIRVGRMLKNYMRKAEVTDVTEGIMRIDIKDVRWEATPGRHTYAYFPTLNPPLRPWETQRFSIIPTALLQSRGHSVAASSSSSGSRHSVDDVEKSGVVAKNGTSTMVTRSSRHVGSTAGISLYVRKYTGLTKALNQHTSLLTLLDGPYPNNSTSGVLKTDRLILSTGGIGIIAVLAFIAHHHNVKLYWTTKTVTQGLVDDLSDVLHGLREKDVRVGGRLDVASTLEKEESEGWKRIGGIVCRPGGLCGDVRSLVSRKGRQGGAVWELVKAFSW